VAGLAISFLIGALLGAVFGFGAWMNRRKNAQVWNENRTVRSLVWRGGAVVLGLVLIGFWGADKLAAAIVGIGMSGLLLLLTLPKEGEPELPDPAKNTVGEELE